MHKALDYAREITQNDPRRKYLSKGYWDTQDYVVQDFYLKDRKPEDDAQWAAMFEHRLATVGEMSRAGVPIMTGTDTGTPEVFPGFAVHDELQLLVQAGLTPMQALQASTLEPAKFLGLEAIAGTIERGKRADLVVLDADPLADITNTQRIHSIVARGRYLDPATRQKMLDDVIAAAATMPADATSVAACPCHS
jgi:predicted amidohydrolase YtcJ